MEKVRIGFVGVGSMGQCAHLRNYAALPDCEVAAIAELRPELAAQVAARYGVRNVYRDHRELLANEELDGIVAVQHFKHHAALVPELAAARIPVLIEKPLATSVEAGRSIVEAVATCGTMLMVGYHKRSDPATAYAKREIDRLKATGELGRMRYVRITMPPGDWIQNGFADLIATDEPLPELAAELPPEDMDEATYAEYAAFVNYYIHQVNLMRHLLGESFRVTFAEPSGVILATESESGVAGIIEMQPYTTTTGWEESALVCFEHGYVRIDLPAPLVMNRAGRVEILRDPGDGATPEVVIPRLPAIHAMRQQAANFLRVVRGEISPPCGAQEALEDLEMAREYMRMLKSGGDE